MHPRTNPVSDPSAMAPLGRLALGALVLPAMLATGAPAAPVASATLDLPSASERAALEVEDFGSYDVPTAPWTQAGLKTVPAEGKISLEAWQVDTPETTLQLLAPLRSQLAEQGYDVLFECAGSDCGGFDFRYETQVLPEPEMHVDLSDFRFLSASRPGDKADFVTLLVSRSSTTGYVQVARVGPALPSAQTIALSTKSPATLAVATAGADLAGPGTSLSQSLELRGRVVLDDLSFESGSARLANGEFGSLDALAAYLGANPGRHVTLVGHTDAEGSLTANIALSRSRARAVMQRLTDGYGIPADQVEADGVGYLMPVASNLTDAGRMSNRRVEAVLTSVD